MQIEHQSTAPQVILQPPPLKTILKHRQNEQDAFMTEDENFVGGHTIEEYVEVKSSFHDLVQLSKLSPSKRVAPFNEQPIQQSNSHNSNNFGEDVNDSRPPDVEIKTSKGSLGMLSQSITRLVTATVQPVDNEYGVIPQTPNP